MNKQTAIQILKIDEDIFQIRDFKKSLSIEQNDLQNSLELLINQLLTDKIKLYNATDNRTIEPDAIEDQEFISYIRKVYY